MFRKKIDQLKRYSAFATGDFERIFSGLEPPPCPEVVTAVLKAMDDPDIGIEDIQKILESDAALSAKILSVANSALYGARSRISSISKAISMLGLQEIGAITLGYALVKATADPSRTGFDMKSYWSDTLTRAIFAKKISRLTGMGSPEEAFSGALFQDIALPVILKQWFDTYERVFNTWLREKQPLAVIENRILKWTHGEAGAWIAGRWELPDILVCAIGLHEGPLSKIEELHLMDSAIPPVVLSSMIPSILLWNNTISETVNGKEEEIDPFWNDQIRRLVKGARELEVSLPRLADVLEETVDSVEDLALALGVKVADTELHKHTLEAVAEIKQ